MPADAECLALGSPQTPFAFPAGEYLEYDLDALGAEAGKLTLKVNVRADQRMRIVFEGNRLFDGDERLEMPLDPRRLTYVHVVRGEIRANGQALRGGDAAMLSGEALLRLGEGRDAKVLVFDLAELPQ